VSIKWNPGHVVILSAGLDCVVWITFLIKYSYASETLLSVENRKLWFVHIYKFTHIYRYVRHQNVALAPRDVHWAELSLKLWVHRCNLKLYTIVFLQLGWKNQIFGGKFYRESWTLSCSPKYTETQEHLHEKR